MNKKTLAWAACLVFSLVSGMPAAQAQSGYPAYPPPPASYTQEQLDQMLAPVALYPDSLLAQVLMAATYPLEVVQAQRFVEARPGLQGDGLARAVAPMPWDPSVKALVQFPAVLAMMNDRLDWMQQLGQAFLAQQPAVMDTVQNLRERAQIAGTLESGPQQRVLADAGAIVIEPVNPQVIYVPYYNPVVAYGSWWWPSAQPVYWTPPPRYRPPHYNPGVTVGISFSSGIGVMRAAFGDARPDWRQRQVMVTQTRITNVTNNVTVNRNVTVNQQPVVWHHDSRRGGPRPQPAQAAQQAGGRPDGPRGAPPFNAPAPNAQQRVAQQDQERQREAREQQVAQMREAQSQQRQREQQAHEQQRQREQMINDQQRQRERMAQEQSQQHQAQERQGQQRQQQLRDMQMQQAEQAREQQRQVHQQQQQQRQQQQQEQARQQQEHARQQQDQSRRQQEQARQQQNERKRDDGR